MTIAQCLLQSSLQSCYANHLLQACAASLLLHKGNHQHLLESLSHGTENPGCEDAVKPRLISFGCSHPSPLTACIALLMLKKSSGVPSNPLRKQSRMKSRAKTSYENQIPSFTGQQASLRPTFSVCQQEGRLFCSPHSAALASTRYLGDPEASM